MNIRKMVSSKILPINKTPPTAASCTNDDQNAQKPYKIRCEMSWSSRLVSYVTSTSVTALMPDCSSSDMASFSRSPSGLPPFVCVSLMSGSFKLATVACVIMSNGAYRLVASFSGRRDGKDMRTRRMLVSM